MSHAQVAYLPTKQGQNEKTFVRYCLLLCALAVSVALIRQFRCQRRKSSWKSSKSLIRAQSICRRMGKHIFNSLKLDAIWIWLGRPSADLTLLVGVFLIANAILCSTGFAGHAMNHFASRYGWMSSMNMMLCVFLSMKNSLVSLFTRISHIELNILHRIVGYVACAFIIGHALLYTIFFGRMGAWHRFIEQGDLAGIGAGVAMMVLLVLGLLRHRNYEVFYASHIIGFAATVFLTILHRPSLVKKLPFLMLFTLSLWLVDRIIRGGTLLWRLPNSKATCYPLPGGGIRLLLTKPAAGVISGSHCYLWIPAVRLFQMHPFTVVGSGPAGLELVIKSNEGFTKALEELAINHPGRLIRASIDGPYGMLASPDKYDRLVLIAGGSGAAYTFGLMHHMLRSSGRKDGQHIHFIWAVKSRGQLCWFAEQLEELQELSKVDDRFTLIIHITAEVPRSTEACICNTPTLLTYLQNGSLVDGSETEPLLKMDSHKHLDFNDSLELQYGCLDVDNAINNALRGSDNLQPALVTTCGPKSLMQAVQSSVNGFMDQSMCSIDLHLEDFGN